VTASDLVSVRVSLYGSCSSYTAVPESSLGSEYYVATLLPISVGDAAIIIITGISTSLTTVNVTFPPDVAIRYELTLSKLYTSPQTV
jgi:hypothetical protein